ncbi:MAG TPA: hypothetical protein PLJ65_02415 [Casimicrobium sp.]|nr:hypothetical protein [Casimicrobium sp.]
MSKAQANSRGGAPMTMARAAAIQSATARANGGKVTSGSFAARAQSAAAHNAASGQVGSTATPGGVKVGN